MVALESPVSNQNYIYISIYLCICLYLLSISIYRSLWGYFTWGHGRTQSRLKVLFFCLVPSYPWEWCVCITLLASLNPCFLCEQTHSVFWIQFFSKYVTITDETSNSSSYWIFFLSPFSVNFIRFSEGIVFSFHMLVLYGLELHWHCWLPSFTASFFRALQGLRLGYVTMRCWFNVFFFHTFTQKLFVMDNLSK